MFASGRPSRRRGRSCQNGICRRSRRRRLPVREGRPSELHTALVFAVASRTHFAIPVDIFRSGATGTMIPSAPPGILRSRSQSSIEVSPTAIRLQGRGQKVEPDDREECQEDQPNSKTTQPDPERAAEISTYIDLDSSSPPDKSGGSYCLMLTSRPELYLSAGANRLRNIPLNRAS